MSSQLWSPGPRRLSLSQPCLISTLCIESRGQQPSRLSVDSSIPTLPCLFFGIVLANCCLSQSVSLSQHTERETALSSNNNKVLTTTNFILQTVASKSGTGVLRLQKCDGTQIKKRKRKVDPGQEPKYPDISTGYFFNILPHWQVED